MLKVANVTWSLSDDILFNNLSLVLFANGCKWACPGCHNKALQCFESTEIPIFSESSEVMGYISEAMTKNVFLNDLTIVGSGGDFFFQLSAWLDFARQLKTTHPSIKLLWYTGAEYSGESLIKIGPDIGLFDGILWGRLRAVNNKVVKTLSLGSEQHIKGYEIETGDYNNTFEEIKSE